MIWSWILLGQVIIARIQDVGESPVAARNGQELVLRERIEGRDTVAGRVTDDLDIPEIDHLQHVVAFWYDDIPIIIKFT